jgi:hypothetical protein
MFRDTFLRSRLLMPLGLATVASLFGAYGWPRAAIFLDLALLFFGILVTVGYVDAILHQHEKRQWEVAQPFLHARVENVANLTWSQFRIAFGFRTEIFPPEAIQIENQASRRRALIAVARDIVAPSVELRVKELDSVAWRGLAKQLQGTWNAIERTLEVFGHRLAPMVTAELMRMADHLERILIHYTTFPDLIGVADKDLPASGGHDHRLHRSALESLIEREVQGAIQAAVNILEWVLRESAPEGPQYGG